MPGFYEDWVLTERSRLRDAYLSALRQVVQGFAEMRQYERAIDYSHHMVQADPLREGTYYNLMRLLMTVGRPAEALHQYETLERLLQKELQSGPSAPLREFAAKLRQTAALPPRSAETQAAQGLSRPTGNPARSSDVPRPTAKLPLQFTRFFGREEEIARLTTMLGIDTQGAELEGVRPTGSDRIASSPSRLTHEDSRLITLTGPGGTGKTRLAVEAALCIKEIFPGWIWFVSLAELNDPLRFGELLRDALELPRQTYPTAIDQAVDFLKALERPCLLILDNFEQITAGGAPVVWTLLHRVPELRCLVTSRKPLSLPGEREIPVLPLPTPREDASSASVLTHLSMYPGIALFVDRAQAARPEFQITQRNAGATAAICRKLEGLPLAIELAAARAKALTPTQILDRLAERFELLTAGTAGKEERHRSLWTAIEWSYRLLPSDLQRFFVRLSVFRGGWSLEAAEAVCDEPMALPFLEQLRSHSLLYTEESTTTLRFRMLETIRDFAEEQLTLDEHKLIRQRHASYFLQWVTAAQVTGAERLGWFERFEEDLDNLRAVLAWSLGQENEVEFGLLIASTLVTFWRVRGHLSEGREWHARLLERAGDTPTVGLGKALYGAGALSSLVADFQTALPLLERCREVALVLGEDDFLAIVYCELGSCAYRQGDYDQARLHYETYLALARAHGTRARIASALTNLAGVAQATGELSTSRRLHAESLEIWAEVGDLVGKARTMHNLAVLALSERQWNEARSYFEQSLQIKRELTDHYGISASLIGLAEASKEQGDHAAAFRHVQESLFLARGQDMRANLVDVLHCMIELARAIGELETAARMYGVLEKVRAEMNYPLTPINQKEYDQIQAAVREALGPEAYKVARSEGVNLSLDRAMTCLEELLSSRLL